MDATPGARAGERRRDRGGGHSLRRPRGGPADGPLPSCATEGTNRAPQARSARRDPLLGRPRRAAHWHRGAVDDGLARDPTALRPLSAPGRRSVANGLAVAAVAIVVTPLFVVD